MKEKEVKMPEIDILFEKQIREFAVAELISKHQKELKEIENKKQEVKILIMTKKSHLSDKKREVALFIGDNTPKDTILISKVPSSIAIFLNFAFHSKYFHKNRQLEHITSILGNKTLLTNLIHFSLGEFGVILKEE